MRISDWSSDVCSSDLGIAGLDLTGLSQKCRKEQRVIGAPRPQSAAVDRHLMGCAGDSQSHEPSDLVSLARVDVGRQPRTRSEEHTSELQSLMRISYAVFCLKKKNNQQQQSKLIQNSST